MCPAMAHSLARSTAVRYARVAELPIDAANARFWVEVDTSGTGIRDTVGLMGCWGVWTGGRLRY